MYRFIIVSTFLLAFFTLFIYYLKDFISTKQILLSFVLTFCFKFFLFQFPFFGIEYEDAFIFSQTARQFSEGIFTDSFITEAIAVGSIENPQISSSYSGHFITFSVFVSWFIKIFGYSPNITSYVNTLLQFLIFVTLSSSSKLFYNSNKLWWVIPIVFTLSPAVNLISCSHLSETFSSFLVLVVISSFVFWRIKRDNLIALLFVIGYLIAINTKRENNVIFFFLACQFLVDLFFQKKLISKTYIFLLFIPLLGSIISQYFIHDIFSTERAESLGIAESTFSIAYLKELLPIFIGTIINFKFFTIIGALLLASFVLIFFQNHFKFIFPLLTLLVCYLLIYSFHFRSYYFVHYNIISNFETFRYLNNFSPIIAILGGFSIIYLFQNLKRKLKFVQYLIVLPVILSGYYTIQMRKEYSDLEFKTRFEIPTKILETIASTSEENTILVSSYPIIFQVLGPRDLNICDIHLAPHYIESSKSQYQVFLFQDESLNSEQFQRRYPATIKWFNNNSFIEVENFRDNQSLLRLTKE